MTESRPGPMARVWTLVGGDLDDEPVQGAVADEAVPRVVELPGFLGAYGLLDRTHRTMVSIDLWEDGDALAGSEAVLDRISEAVAALSGVESRDRRHYELVYSHPHADVHGSPDQSGEQLAALLVMVRGGDLTDPEVLVTMVNAQAAHLASAPGFVSAMLLLDRAAPALLGLSVWTDAAAAEHTMTTSSWLPPEVAERTPGSTGSVHLYEVRAVVPVTLPFPGPVGIE